MADPDSKTEEATPQRRRDAQEKGQIPYSGDLVQGAALLSGVMVLWLGAGLASGLRNTMRNGLGSLRTNLTPADLPVMAASSLWNFLQTVGPLLATVVAMALFAGIMQSGGNISVSSLSLDLGRLSPIKGWSRIWSSRSAMRALTALLKLTALILIAVWILKGRFGRIAGVGRAGLLTAVQTAWDTASALAVSVAAALTIVGLIDFFFQRWKHEQDLRMSKQEVKDDHKQEEGDPMIKARLRKLQRERANGKMMQDVPNATVIVTNPTHISVALQYDRSTMSAPKVVAKGAGALALRIRKIAMEHDVPIVERKPVARALYAAVEVGDEIPLDLYQAVAEILSYIFRLRRH